MTVAGTMNRLQQTVSDPLLQGRLQKSQHALPKSRHRTPVKDAHFSVCSSKCLKASLRPFAIRYPRGAGENTEWRNEPVALEIGRGERLRDGKDVAVVSTGPIASEVEKALKETEAAGISAHRFWS